MTRTAPPTVAIPAGTKSWMNQEALAEEQQEYRRYWDADFNRRPRAEYMIPFVRLHREGEQVAISTNAEQEHDFISGFSKAFDEAIDELGTVRGVEKLREYWLAQMVDICCVMRGYKGPTVTQQRLLLSGKISPREDTVIASSDARPTVEAAPA